MIFTSNTQLGLYVLSKLDELGEASVVAPYQRALQKLLLNHNVNQQSITLVLARLSKGTAGTPLSPKVTAIALMIEQASMLLEQSPIIQFSAVLPRAIEGYLALPLFLSPTDDMMQSLQKVSVRIIGFLESLRKRVDGWLLLKKMLADFYVEDGHTRQRVFCGAMPISHFAGRSPCVDDQLDAVILLLTQNKATDFAHIVCLHFLYCKHVIRKVAFTQAGVPLKNKKLDSAIADYYKHHRAESGGFYRQITRKKVSLLIDRLPFLASRLYSTDSKRGKVQHYPFNRQTLGLFSFLADDFCAMPNVDAKRFAP